MAAAVEGRDYLAELRAGIEANLAAARERLAEVGASRRSRTCASGCSSSQHRSR